MTYATIQSLSINTADFTFEVPRWTRISHYYFAIAKRSNRLGYLDY